MKFLLLIFMMCILCLPCCVVQSTSISSDGDLVGVSTGSIQSNVHSTGLVIGSKSITGSGRLSQKTLKISPTSIVNASGQLTLNIHCINDETKLYLVEISADDNILPYVNTKVKDNQLHIGMRSGMSYKLNKPIIVNVYLPSLNVVQVSGQINATVKGEIITTSAAAVIRGQSQCNMESLTAKEFAATITGQSSLTIQKGHVIEQIVHADGLSNYKARGVKTASSQIGLSGKSTATIFCTKTLEGELSGISTIHLYGSATHQVPTSGLSRVIEYE